MEDLSADPIWRDYERVSQSHGRAMKQRLDAELDLTRRVCDESLENWMAAQRGEEKCYEELKAMARAVWAKFHQ